MFAHVLLDSFMSCHFMSCHVISCHVMPFHSFHSFQSFHLFRSFHSFNSFHFISFIHSFIQWFNQKSVHWFIEAFIASFIQYCKSLIHELIHFLVNSLIHLLFQWLIDLPYSLFWQPFAHSFDAPRNPNLSLILPSHRHSLRDAALFRNFRQSAAEEYLCTWYSYIILSLYNIARANVRAYA